MAIATTTTMSASVVTAYLRDYLYYADLQTAWAKLLFPHMRKAVVGGKELRGKTIQVPVYSDIAEVTTSLTETADVTPVGMDDSYVQVTMAEEGNVVQTTRFLENIAAYTDIGKVAARMVAKNMAVRRDKILRNAIVYSATDVIYGGTATTRNGLDTTNDKITYAKIVEAVERARSKGVPALPDGTYFTVVHPAIMQDLVTLEEWKNPAYYQNVTIITDGSFKGIENGRLPYEFARLYDLRFVRSPYGKLFLGAGTAAQTATTLSAAAAAGATTVTVTSATGLTAGDYITIGTVESGSTVQHTTEQVLITNVNGTTLTIKGGGAEGEVGDTGLKFAHANGSAVTEAPNVAAIPILGPESAVIAFASDVGWEGEVALEWAATNIPKRFINHSWYWVGGAAIVDQNVVQLEVAISGKVIGNN